MTIHTETLTTSWYELTDLDDQTFVMIQTTGDDIDLVVDVAEPDVSATSFVFSAGLWRIDIPDGKSVWVRCPSGTADITFSQFSGVVMNTAVCAFAYTDAISVDELVTGQNIVVGDDDSVPDKVNYVAFVETEAAGIAGAATINSAVLSLRFSRRIPGQVIRIHGVAESTSQAASVTSWAAIVGSLTLTTEYVDVTVGYEEIVRTDITDLLQELVNVSGWDATSPVQFTLGPTSAVTTGEDTTVSVFIDAKQTAVFALAT